MVRDEIPSGMSSSGLPVGRTASGSDNPPQPGRGWGKRVLYRDRWHGGPLVRGVDESVSL